MFDGADYGENRDDEHRIVLAMTEEADLQGRKERDDGGEHDVAVMEENPYVGNVEYEVFVGSQGLAKVGDLAELVYLLTERKEREVREGGLAALEAESYKSKRID